MIPITSPALVEAVDHRLASITMSGMLLERMRAEFVEMPGLTLTLSQAARLWCLTAPQAKAALTELVDGGVLMRDPKGVYRRRGSCPRCS